MFSDILHNQIHGDAYVHLLSDRMIGILQSTLESSIQVGNSKEIREKILILLKIWKDNSFFSISKIQGWIDIMT